MKNFLLTGMFIVWASSANAGIFDGQTLQYTYLFPDQTTEYSNAPNGNYLCCVGIEVSPITDGIGSLDLQSDGFAALFTDSGGFNPASFNGFRITDINGTIPSFTSFTLGLNTALSGDPSLSFDDNNLYVNWQNLSWIPGEVDFNVGVNAIRTLGRLFVDSSVQGSIAAPRRDEPRPVSE